MPDSSTGGENSLSFLSVTAIGIGGMVGGGIFAVLGLAVKLGRGGTPIAFAIAGMVALITSYSYARMSVTFPSEGGTVEFLVKGLGGWFMGNRVAGEISLIREKLPRAQKNLGETLRGTGWGQSLISLTQRTEKLWSLDSGIVDNLTGFFSETVGVVVSVAFVIAAGIYISINPELYVE